MAALSEAASMGPQLFSCGDPTVRRLEKWEAKLQWGHNFSVVEIQAVRESRGRCYGASMGPQLFSCGDRPSGRALRHKPSRFNGATTFQLWRCPRSVVFLACLSGFNGATTFQLWRSLKETLVSQSKPCFNGATTFQLWR